MEKVVLALAILLGIFFRVWQIGQIPAGLAMDEAAFGYNAWSIATTGKDEFGQAWPYVFRSFADFKLPAYGYLTTVVMKFFGPGVWQTRTVSVAAGLASCFLLYLLVRHLSNKKLAIVSGLVMLWSPWGVFFSRGAFEGNLGLTLMLAGIYGLVRARKERRFLFLAAISFAVANYAYITYKFVGPVLFIGWIFFYRKAHRFGRVSLAAIVMFTLLSLPAFLMFSGITGSNRIESLLKLSRKETGYPTIAQLTSNYLTYLSPRNLFFRPDPVRHRHFQELSTFYPYLFIFWLIGVYLFFKTRKTDIVNWTSFLFLVGSIPATLAADPYATLRAIPLLPAYSVLLAIGVVWSFDRLGKYWWFLASGMIILMSIQLYAALMVMKHGQTAEWNGGMDQLARQLSVYPARPIYLDIPNDVYPNLALEVKFPPTEMQRANRTSRLDLEEYYTDSVFPKTIIFGRYQVGRTDRSEAGVIPGAILVTRPEGLFTNEPQSKGWKELFRVKDTSGRDLFLGFALN